MKPSCSRTRRRSESVRGLIPGQERSSSEKRRGPSDRSWTITAVHLAPIRSAVQATEQLASWTGRIVRMRSLYPAGFLVPGRRVVHPAPADHRGDDGRLAELSRRAFERVAVEDDEVGEPAGDELPSPPLRALEPGRGHAGGVESLLDADCLLGMPSGPVVDGAEDARSDPREGIELLDGRVGSVHHVSAGVE